MYLVNMPLRHDLLKLSASAVTCWPVGDQKRWHVLLTHPSSGLRTMFVCKQQITLSQPVGCIISAGDVGRIHLVSEPHDSSQQQKLKLAQAFLL